jgi:hypothetical protein
MLCATVGLSHTKAQSAESAAAASSASPSAWVYVTVQETQNGNAQHSKVEVFQASSEGRLTAIPGSPFADDVCCTAVNGQYFFGADWGGYGSNIPSYTVESNGALTYSASSDALADDDGCGFTGPIFSDHSGSTIYMYDGDEGICSASRIRAFGVNKDNGKLTLLGDVSNVYLPPALAFSGNNQFAYGQGGVVAAVQGFKRNGNGSLTSLNIHPPLPTPPLGGYFYTEAGPVAADPANHLAVPVLLHRSDGSAAGYYPQLATYTIDSDGNLTTASTSDNMTYAYNAGGAVIAMAMSPSGKLLAVAGDEGLQVKGFNGANPITPYTAALTWDEVDQVAWDNDNHLYAISMSQNKLWVFTVTTKSYSEAPGSPYTIDHLVGLTVQSLPRYQSN